MKEREPQKSKSKTFLKQATLGSVWLIETPESKPDEYTLRVLTSNRSLVFVGSPGRPELVMRMVSAQVSDFGEKGFEVVCPQGRYRLRLLPF